MLEARRAAVEPNIAPPLDLQIGFLVDRWGPEAILGPSPNLFELIRISKLLHVYSVFQQSTQPNGMKRMSRSDRRLMLEVMSLAAEDG